MQLLMVAMLAIIIVQLGINCTATNSDYNHAIIEIMCKPPDLEHKAHTYTYACVNSSDHFGIATVIYTSNL